MSTYLVISFSILACLFVVASTISAGRVFGLVGAFIAFVIACIIFFGGVLIFTDALESNDLYLIESLDDSGEVVSAFVATDYNKQNRTAEVGADTTYMLGDRYRIVEISDADGIEPGPISLEEVSSIEALASSDGETSSAF